jgi:hypothetical protein
MVSLSINAIPEELVTRDGCWRRHRAVHVMAAKRKGPPLLPSGEQESVDWVSHARVTERCGLIDGGIQNECY